MASCKVEGLRAPNQNLMLGEPAVSMNLSLANLSCSSVEDAGFAFLERSIKNKPYDSRSISGPLFALNHLLR